MKKIFAITSVLLLAGLFTSCSGNGSTTVDNTSKDERLGVEWFSQNGEVKYTTQLNETEEGAHFTLTLPENPDQMVRPHFEAVSKKTISSGDVKVLYASQRYSNLSSIQESIAQVVSDNEEVIKNSITSFEADVQTTWSQVYEMEEESNQGLYIYYLPLRLNYYSDTDETANGVLFTYVLVPVKVVATTYSLTDGVYTFEDASCEANKGNLVSWTASKSGSIA